MATTVHFTNELVLELLESYKRNQLLWDTLNPDYKDRVKKNEAWEEIANYMKMPRRDVESKIHILRSQFTREKKKIAFLRKNGKENAKSSWFAFEAMKFLMKGEVLEESDNLEIQIQHNSDSQFSESFQAENFKIETADLFESTDTPPPNSSNHNSRKRTISDEKSDDEGAYSFNKRFGQNSKDEFDIYAQYVASELRLTSDLRSVIIAKHYINNILFNARMGKYRSSASTSTGAQVTEGSIKIERDVHIAD